MTKPKSEAKPKIKSEILKKPGVKKSYLVPVRLPSGREDYSQRIMFDEQKILLLQERRLAEIRVIIKPQPTEKPYFNGMIWREPTPGAPLITSRFEKGMITYAAETWAKDPNNPEKFIYKALRGSRFKDVKWLAPLIFPKEAARIFMEVKDLRVERLQDISEESLSLEGFNNLADFALHWNSLYIKNSPRRNGARITWQTNPWVWVTVLEKIDVVKL
jgi:hypothetical protein